MEWTKIGEYSETPAQNPSVGAADISRVVEKSVNSVSAFGAKSSVHFLLPEGNPLGGLLLSPPNQVAQPSAALLRYGCGIPLAGTDVGLRRGPQLGELSAYTRKSLPCKGRRCHNVTLCRIETNRFVISPKICPFLLGISTILRLVIDGAPWSR